MTLQSEKDPSAKGQSQLKQVNSLKNGKQFMTLEEKFPNSTLG